LGNSYNYQLSKPLVSYKTFNLSFAGLKTNTKIFVEQRLCKISNVSKKRVEKANFAASFQEVSLDHLADRVSFGIEQSFIYFPECRQIIISGGVAANARLQKCLASAATEKGIEMIYPKTKYCTDNGVMVAWTGVERMQQGLAYSSAITIFNFRCELKSRWPLGKIISSFITSTKINKQRNIAQKLTKNTSVKLYNMSYKIT